MADSNIVDEMYVKVGLDTSEYNDGVEKLTNDNEKLAEGLEDVEKQFDKTSKSTQENAKKTKQSDDEFKRLNSSLGITLSHLAKIGAAFATGLGVTKLVSGIADANDQLNFLSKKSGVSVGNLKKLGYTANNLGGDGDGFQQSIYNMSKNLAANRIEGDVSLASKFNALDIAYADEDTGRSLSVEEVLKNIINASDKYIGNEQGQQDLAYILGALGFSEQDKNVFMHGKDTFWKEYNSHSDKYTPTDSDLKTARNLSRETSEIFNNFSALGDLFSSKFSSSLEQGAKDFNNFLSEFQETLKGFNPDDFTVPFLDSIEEAKSRLDEILGSKKYNDAVAKVLDVVVRDNSDSEYIVKQYINDFGKDHLNDLVRDNVSEKFATIEDGKYKWEDGGIEVNLLKSIIGKHGIDKNNPEQMAKYGFDKIDKFNNQGSEIAKNTDETAVIAGGILASSKEIERVNKNLEVFFKKFFSVDPDDVKEFGLTGAIDRKTNPQNFTKSTPISSDMVSAREKQAIDFYMSKGLTKEQAIGITANLKRESGLNHTAVNPNEVDSKGNKFSSKGIAQWNRGRLDKFAEVFDKDMDESSFEDQLKFTYWEFNNTHKKAFEELKKSTDVYGATKAIMEHYEVPANQSKEIIERANLGFQMLNSYQPYDPMSNPMAFRNINNTSNVDNSKRNTEITIQSITVNGVEGDFKTAGVDIANSISNQLAQLTGGLV